MSTNNINVKDFIKFVTDQKTQEDNASYTLKIEKENKKIIKEEQKKEILPVSKNNKENQISSNPQPNIIDFLKSKNPNEAEDVLIKNLIDRKDIDKRTKDWLQINEKLHSTPPEQKTNQRMSKTFIEMLDFTLNFFNIVKNDMNKALGDLKNEQSQTSQNVNKSFDKNFKMKLTPREFASYSLFEFELLCVINRVHVGTYLKNIELIMNQNQIIVNLLKNPHDLRLIKSSISIFKNSLEKYDVLRDPNAIKKFEQIDKEIKKRFDKSEAALADLNESKNALYEHNQTMIENARRFCEQLSNDLLTFEEKSDDNLEFAQKLSQAADAFVEEIENSNEKIKNKLSKDMKALKERFDKELGRRKDLLQQRFGELLKKEGLKSFQQAYNENASIFNSIYQSCMSKIDDSKLSELLSAAKQFKEKYNSNLKKIESQIEKEKDTVTQQQDDTVDDQKAKLKITNNTTELTPVSVQNKD